MAVGIAGYSHVAICVHDQDRAHKFYTEVLGFESLDRPDFGFPGGWYKVGNMQLHLRQADEVLQENGKFGGIGHHFAVHIPTDSFHETFEAIRGRGAEVAMEPSQRESDGIWAAFVKDTEGNIIELTDLGPMS